MSYKTKSPFHGIALSYASSFWIWASLKAARNRRWLLSLIALTTFLMQALTISMSTLFQQSSVSMPDTFSTAVLKCVVTLWWLRRT
ncbi:hypothetical protein BU25DRAFT_97872 [Macroventuria anomochaeta]|uniref:Uncharacterized protein n=1 Tax=Macroventuria anomochaeta TaxID=301207 RepID=A0ACB6RZU4_9PLEO|nr:uncharacterized protein BU25DRAFT_97872 [Macroventuria anomochaeta]KAF2626407.1 hypothetical protein BU25DRAFT_97872 [Macroventuria anomochaeta]